MKEKESINLDDQNIIVNNSKYYNLNLLELCKRETLTIGVGMTALLVNSLTNLMFPFILGRAIDQVSTNSDNYNIFINPSTISTTLFVIGSISSWIRTFSIGLACERVSCRIRNLIFDAYIERDMSSQENEGLDSEFISLIDKDARTAAEVYTEKLVSGIRAFNSSLYGSALLYRISPLLCITSLSVLPILGVGAMTLSKRSRLLQEKLRASENDTMSFSLERISQVRAVQTNQQSKAEKGKFMSHLSDCLKLSSASHFSKGIFMGFLNLSTNLSLLAVLSVGGKLISKGSITPGQLAQFGIQSVFVGLGFSGLSTFYSDMKTGFQAVHRISKSLHMLHNERTNECTQQAISSSEYDFSQNIVLKDLCFEYANRSSLILDNICLTIKSGSITAFTGESGSGKSSLMLLLASILKPTSGNILLGHDDISDIPLYLFYSKVGIVEQDSKLFSGSIKDNISYGKSDCTNADVIAASMLAYAHDFILSFPDGYDTQVGLNGCMLSGGQRVRISLARALIKQPSLLFLDEVTSALDEASEEVIMETFQRLRTSTTIVLFSHSDRLINIADAVYMLDNGKVVH